MRRMKGMYLYVLIRVSFEIPKVNKIEYEDIILKFPALAVPDRSLMSDFAYD